MKPPAEDLDRRRPVWEALSAVFLDTEINDEWREHIVNALLSSGYSDAELEEILWSELCPVLHVNFQTVAGEWAGFRMEYVEQRILSQPAGRLRRWWAYVNGGSIAKHAWKEIKKAMVEKPRT